MSKLRFRIPKQGLGNGTDAPKKRYMVRHEILGNCMTILTQDLKGEFGPAGEWGLRIMPDDIRQGSIYQRMVTEDSIFSWMKDNGWDTDNLFPVHGYFQVKEFTRFYLESGPEYTQDRDDAPYNTTLKLVWGRLVKDGGEKRFQFTVEWPNKSVYNPFNERFPSCKLYMSKKEMEIAREEDRKRSERKMNPSEEQLSGARIRLK